MEINDISKVLKKINILDDFKYVYQTIEQLTGERPSTEEKRILAGVKYSVTAKEMEMVVKKYPATSQVYSMANKKVEDVNDVRMKHEATLLCEKWSKNKQIYSFDMDFLYELMKTDKLTYVYNGWDYLPYDTFYVDISNNKEVSTMLGDGFFIHVEKVDENSYVYEESIYIAHVLVSYNGNLIPQVLEFVNKNTANKIEEKRNNLYSNDGEPIISYPYGLLEALVSQILTYLSSLEPDIQESEFSKRSYRKPNPSFEPKNKLSEVQQWNVGDEFGISYRKWKKEQEEEKETDNPTVSRFSGRKKRPHARKAHWSHYWYGHGEDKVRRPKWISATFVNAKNEVAQMAVTKIS